MTSDGARETASVKRALPLKVIGLLLAAGRGRRMGTTKQLLRWEGEDDDVHKLSTTVVAASFDLIASFSSAMFVTVGHDRANVMAALGDRQFRPVEVESNAEMFESIRAGLHVIIEIGDFDAVMLHPADVPGVRRATVATLLGAFREDQSRAVMPVFDARGGHPVIIPASIVPQILQFRATGGLRQFWLENPALCVRLPVADERAIRDLNTPEDYARR